MKRGIEHIQINERIELKRALDMILEEFEDELALAKHDWKTKAQIAKIILYGSRARGDWVDEHHTRVGKHSDWDLLILVNDIRLTNRQKYWSNVSERLMREYMYTRRLISPVHLLVYTIEQINASLEGGHYFFLDFLQDGIVVYETDEAQFVDPKPLPPQRSFDMASGYFAEKFVEAMEFYDNYQYSESKNRIKNAALQLQQCVEMLYQTVLLTFTLHSPHSRNIVELRNAAEQHVPELYEAWPRGSASENQAFETLQRAYAKWRYPRDYDIAEEQLSWLGQRGQKLISLVEKCCKSHLERLKASLPE